VSPFELGFEALHVSSFGRSGISGSPEKPHRPVVFNVAQAYCTDMGILDAIRSLLGSGGSDDTDTTDVIVEGEPGDETDDTGSNERVESDPGDETGDPAPDDAAAAGTDATASTGSMVEKPTSDPETAAEPAEAGAGVTEHSGTETAAAEPAEAAGPAPDGPDASAANIDTEGSDTDRGGDGSGSEPVDTVNGIGPAYAERLGEAGIETVAELLEADAEALGERTSISGKRIARWQDRAAE